MLVLAVLISLGIPGLFLAIIYMLDLYASRAFRLVLFCFAWGAIGGLGLSFAFNTYVAFPLIEEIGWSEALLYLAFAPVAEEVLKSLWLLYVVRRAEFTYFVDGAIYGFAAGIGFSIVENFIYIERHPEQPALLALVRVFSTCLMHGVASGLVGGAVGRFRLSRRSGGWLALVAGCVGAVVLHALFNGISWAGLVSQALVPLLGVVVGLAGVGLMVYAINLGLREQRRWIVEALDGAAGVTPADARAAGAYGSTFLDSVLGPVFEQFPRRGRQMMHFVRQQAQVGIKRKVQEQVDDPELKQQLSFEIARVEDEVGQLRREMGTCAQIYVQCVFPEKAGDTWSCLQEMISCEESTQGGEE